MRMNGCTRLASNLAAVLVMCGIGWPAYSQSFVNFETAQVHPVDLSPDAKTLAVCNTADNSVELFDVQLGTAVPIARIPAGLDPVTARFRTVTELWVVNQISDSVSVVDLTTKLVRATLATSDKPADVIFAGSPASAFVSCSTRDEVLVFNPLNLGVPPISIPIEGEEPRALAKSANGSQVYVAIFESGNRSTVLAGGLATNPAGLPNVVSDPLGPYAGANPAPNSGASFSPPLAPGLPAPPAVGLIVKKDPATGQWLDSNDGDWTDLVSGVNAAHSARVPGWDVVDNDVAIIDANTRAVTGYATGLMNICMAIAVNPANGGIGVVGTDGINEVRFEPNVNGVFLRVLAAGVDPVTLEAEVTDLNFHLDYTAPTLPQAQRDLSLGDPRGIAWNSSGSILYVTGMGSNNLLIMEPATARVKRINLGEGPTGLALDPSRRRLYVLNRFSGEISVIDTSAEIEETRISLFDPTPAEIRAGRKHLYDTHKNSGLGHVACASCHVDARMDRLAWDLGNPLGGMLSAADQNLGMSIPGLNSDFTDFHPMKGPMATQTFQDIVGKEPFHWRGDRDGLEEFNPAFMGLQGDDTSLTPVEMQQFEDFLATIHFPPNPNRALDNSLPSSLPLPGQFASGRFAASGGLDRGDPLPAGDAQRGLRLFMGGESPNDSMDGVLNCVTCHTLPIGNGADSFLNVSTVMFQPFPIGPLGNHHVALVSVDGSTQRAIKVPQLRNGMEKAGMDLSHASSRSGFGYLHDGSVDSLASFLSSQAFDVRTDQDVADLVALMLSFSGSDFSEPENPVPGLPEEPPSYQFSRDAHAVVGQQVTNNSASPSSEIMDRMTTILIPAIQGRASAVVKGKKAGVWRGWVFLSYNGVDTFWQSDKAGETATGQQLIALAAPGNEFTLTAVPLGSGVRIGIDRDLDGILNLDETLQQSIQVLSPNGAEAWERGTQHLITWTATSGSGANVRIRLWNGLTSTNVISSTPNDGSHLWKVPTTAVLASTYKIGINSTTTPAITDTSDDTFTITPVVPRTVKVLYPNGGEPGISRGLTIPITWSTSGGPISDVKIKLTRGTSTVLLASSTPNDGVFNWTVPVLQTVASNYKIRIEWTTNAAIRDVSDATFAILP